MENRKLKIENSGDEEEGILTQRPQSAEHGGHIEREEEKEGHAEDRWCAGFARQERARTTEFTGV